MIMTKMLASFRSMDFQVGRYTLLLFAVANAAQDEGQQEPLKYRVQATTNDDRLTIRYTSIRKAGFGLRFGHLTKTGRGAGLNLIGFEPDAMQSLTGTGLLPGMRCFGMTIFYKNGGTRNHNLYKWLEKPDVERNIRKAAKELRQHGAEAVELVFQIPSWHTNTATPTVELPVEDDDVVLVQFNRPGPDGLVATGMKLDYNDSKKGMILYAVDKELDKLFSNSNARIGLRLEEIIVGYIQMGSLLTANTISFSGEHGFHNAKELWRTATVLINKNTWHYVKFKFSKKAGYPMERDSDVYLLESLFNADAKDRSTLVLATILDMDDDNYNLAVHGSDSQTYNPNPVTNDLPSALELISIPRIHSQDLLPYDLVKWMINNKEENLRIAVNTLMGRLPKKSAEMPQQYHS